MDDMNSIVAIEIELLLSELEKCGGSKDDLFNLDENEKNMFISQIAELIMQKRHGLYRLLVDYDIPLDKMIDAGNFDWINGSINTKNFPIPAEFSGREYVNIKLIPCSDIMSNDVQESISHEEILQYLHDNNMRPGNLPELLAFAAKFPHLQIEFPIVQVGMLWETRGGLRGTYLRRAKKERGLAVIWMQFGFLKYYRIVAIKK